MGIALVTSPILLIVRFNDRQYRAFTQWSTNNLSHTRLTVDLRSLLVVCYLSPTRLALLIANLGITGLVAPLAQTFVAIWKPTPKEAL